MTSMLARVMVVDYGGVLALAPAFDDPVAQAGHAGRRPIADRRAAQRRAEELAREG
ncbi:MAG: hypothetical protein HZY76_00015 [Anaerolineae bacterium]|nr:MAG: hypothetical protein HZY76_00015 [Anaerolineae bacterium]